MYSFLLTLLFYFIAGLIVFRCVPKQFHLLAWGSLPIIWTSLLALTGLFETLLSLPSIISLLILFCGLSFFVLRKDQNDLRTISFAPPAVTFWILLTFLLGEFLIAIQVHLLVPWGSWDPMFTWVLRARFLVDGGNLWTQGFSNDLALLHPDYPPLFSWALVPLWSLDGSRSALAVACLTIPFFAGWMSILTGWWCLIETRNFLWGYLTVAIILGTPFLVYLHAIKSLDFILSYTILTSLAWYHFAKKEQSRSGWMICGFVVAWAALVKNEGQLWMVSFFGSLLLLQSFHFFSPYRKVNTNSQLSRKSILFASLQGVFIPLSFLIWFKISLAPPNDLIEPQRAFEISQVLQPEVFFNSFSLLVRLDQVEEWERHRLILNNLWNVLSNWKAEGLLLCSVPVLLLFILLLRKKPFPSMLLAIGIQLTGYYLVYLLTPYNPYWHVSSSMNRLLIHIAPAAVCLLGFSLCYSPVDSENSKQNAPKYARFLRLTLLSLPLVCLLFCYSQIRSNTFPWDFQSEPLNREEQLASLEFPPVSHATFVTNQFEPAMLYQMQFAALPTVLVVDRREKTLIASFPTEEELKTYCQQNGWNLKQNRAGLGWAESITPDGPLPHMDQIRQRNGM